MTRNFRGGRQVAAAAFVCLLLALDSDHAAGASVPRLAVIIAAPWEGETAMGNDLAAMTDALLQRGFAPQDIVALEGSLMRPVVLALLTTVSRRVASWTDGDIVLIVSGHGNVHGTTPATARPSVVLSSEEPIADYEVFWDEIFATLQIPAGVRLVVLPDT